MGGKKKTKWRKLPLEEFTQEIPPNPEKIPPAEVCQTDLTRDENNYVLSYTETPGIVQNYGEPYEYIDGVWYPTSCVVYNPPMYSTYMMPVDASYYYTMPEAAQMQEYIPVAYPEYTPVLPKDTVYLLLPTQSLRPTQPVQNTAPEWQNRRRRRRYEGYADYAVIPEKSSSKSEETDFVKVPGEHVNSRNSVHPKNFRMSSFVETSKFDDFASEQNLICSQSNAEKRPTSSTNMINENGSANKEINRLILEKANVEMCGVHSKNKIAVTDQQSMDEKNNSLYNDPYLANDVPNLNKEKIFFSNDLESNTTISPNSNNIHDKLLDTHIVSGSINNENKQGEQFDKIDCSNLVTNKTLENNKSLRNSNQETEICSKTNAVKLKDPDESKTKAPNEESLSSLPDILSSLKKTPNEKPQDLDNPRRSPLPDKADADKAKSSKPKSLLSQTSYLPPNLLSSEALHNEMELELKQLQSLHSLQANQSIYKLAFDENVTDQSEADSRSPSPVDAESQVPSSLTSAEILIHEADSGSDAGSEDVELLPHRYESETFLNESKHVYVNKLSLAVELLRTQESLPYDDEFKRVVGENIVPGIHTGGKINLGFVEDSFSRNTNHPQSITNNFENKCASKSTYVNEVVSQCQLKQSADSSNDSAIFSDIDFGNFEEELCEPATEVDAPRNENQDNSEEIREQYRRFGIQAHHYFSPRGALSLNPCFCCIIM